MHTCYGECSITVWTCRDQGDKLCLAWGLSDLGLSPLLLRTPTFIFNLFCLLSDKKGFQCGTPDLNWTDLSSSWSIRVRHICEEFPHERAGPCCLCAGVERTVLSGQCHPSTSYCTTRHKLCTFHWTFAQLQLFDNLNYSSLYNFRVTVKNTFLICKQIPLFHYRLSSNTTSVS